MADSQSAGGFIKQAARLLAGMPLRVARPITKPIKDIIDKERIEARASVHSETLVNLIAALALWAVVEDIISQMMLLSFYSTLESPDFITYHATTPIFKISGAFAFIGAASMRGINYWLIYAIPILLIIGQFILLGLIQGWIQPSDLEVFDFGPKWWRSA